jgi:hypothetical protein
VGEILCEQNRKRIVKCISGEYLPVQVASITQWAEVFVTMNVKTAFRRENFRVQKLPPFACPQSSQYERATMALELDSQILEMELKACK